MADRVTPEQRSAIMKQIRSKNTKPELAVRAMLRELGVHYSLHSKKLPGHPDIVISRIRLVIQVNGCFWHNHRRDNVRVPKTNRKFWLNKINANAARDVTAARNLRSMGWSVWTVWECDIKKRPAALAKRLAKVARAYKAAAPRRI